MGWPEITPRVCGRLGAGAEAWRPISRPENNLIRVTMNTELVKVALPFGISGRGFPCLGAGAAGDAEAAVSRSALSANAVEINVGE
jgi:hypothetical protein